MDIHQQQVRKILFQLLKSSNRVLAASESSTSTDKTIEKALEGLGVEWIKTVHTYEVGSVKKVIAEAFKSSFNGFKSNHCRRRMSVRKAKKIKNLLKLML